MAFWGGEVKPTRPITHKPDASKGRLHISQATLGFVTTAPKKSMVQCKVGNKSPVFLCSLFPEKSESCQLNLEFDEADEVVFLVLGPGSVYLTGYFLPSGDRHHSFPDESESYGEDIGESEPERSIRSSEDKYENSFINDCEPEALAASPISSREDKKKTNKDKGRRGRLTKMCGVVLSDDDDRSQEKDISNDRTGAILEDESDSEDNLTIFSLCKNREAKRRMRQTEERGENESHESGNNGTTVDDNRVKTSLREAGTAGNGEPVRENTENGTVPKKERVEKPKEQERVEAPTLDEEVMKIEERLFQANEEGRKAFNDKENSENGTVSKKKREEKPKRHEPIETPTLDEEVNKIDKNLFKVDEEGCNDKVNTENGTAPKKNGEEKPREHEPIEALKLDDEEVNKIDKNLFKANEEGHKEANDKVNTENGSTGPKKESKENPKEHEPIEAPTIDEEVNKMGKKLFKANEEDDKAANDNKSNLADSALPFTVPVPDGSTTSKKKKKERVKDGKKPSAGEVPENSIKTKGKRKRQTEEAIITTAEEGNFNGMDVDQKQDNDKVFEDATDKFASETRSEEKKKKRKKKSVNVEAPVSSMSESNRSDIEGKNVDDKKCEQKTFDNLVIEDLESGKLDGKVATSGKKIYINYVGKLMENGQVFDTNAGRSPLKFRLGDESVLKGWNIGIDGMRVGGKRKLVIPPSLGYDSEAVGEKVPPNSWVVFEIELVKVR